MAFGKSLELAAIQPGPGRVIVQGRTLVNADTAEKRKAELAGFKREADRRHEEKNQAFLRLVAGRAAAGLTDPPPIVEPWPSIAHWELRRSDAAQTQVLRARKRWWRQNWNRVRRMFEGLYWVMR